MISISIDVQFRERSCFVEKSHRECLKKVADIPADIVFSFILIKAGGVCKLFSSSS